VTGGLCDICGRGASGEVTRTRNVENHEGRPPRWQAFPVHRRCLDALDDFRLGGGHAMLPDWTGMLDDEEVPS